MEYLDNLSKSNEALKSMYTTKYPNENDVIFGIIFKDPILHYQSFDIKETKEEALSWIQYKASANINNSIYLLSRSDAEFITQDTDIKETDKYYTDFIETNGLFIADDKEIKQIISDNSKLYNISYQKDNFNSINMEPKNNLYKTESELKALYTEQYPNEKDVSFAIIFDDPNKEMYGFNIVKTKEEALNQRKHWIEFDNSLIHAKYYIYLLGETICKKLDDLYPSVIKILELVAKDGLQIATNKDIKQYFGEQINAIDLKITKIQNLLGKDEQLFQIGLEIGVDQAGKVYQRPISDNQPNQWQISEEHKKEDLTYWFHQENKLNFGISHDGSVYVDPFVEHMDNKIELNSLSPEVLDSYIFTLKNMSGTGFFSENTINEQIKAAEILHNTFPAYNTSDINWINSSNELKDKAEKLNYKISPDELKDLYQLSKTLISIQAGNELGNMMSEAYEEAYDYPDNLNKATPEEKKSEMNKTRDEFEHQQSPSLNLEAKIYEDQVLVLICSDADRQSFKPYHIFRSEKGVMDKVKEYESQNTNGRYQYEVYAVSEETFWEINQVPRVDAEEENQAVIHEIYTQCKKIATNKEILGNIMSDVYEEMRDINYNEESQKKNSMKPTSKQNETIEERPEEISIDIDSNGSIKIHCLHSMAFAINLFVDRLHNTLKSKIALNVSTEWNYDSSQHINGHKVIIFNSIKSKDTEESIKEHILKTLDAFSIDYSETPLNYLKKEFTYYVLSPKEGLIAKDIYFDEAERICEERGGAFYWEKMSKYNEENLKKDLNKFFHPDYPRYTAIGKANPRGENFILEFDMNSIKQENRLNNSNLKKNHETSIIEAIVCKNRSNNIYEILVGQAPESVEPQICIKLNYENLLEIATDNSKAFVTLTKNNIEKYPEAKHQYSLFELNTNQTPKPIGIGDLYAGIITAIQNNEIDLCKEKLENQERDLGDYPDGFNPDIYNL